MSRVVELAKKVETKKQELDEAVAELHKELGVVGTATTNHVKPEGEKRGRKPKATDGEAPAPASNKKSLKEVVKEVLARNPDGLELKGITAEVQQLIQKGEYSSKASNTTAVVAQAVNALKVEKAINHDTSSKKYSLVKAE